MLDAPFNHRRFSALHLTDVLSRYANTPEEDMNDQQKLTLELLRSKYFQDGLYAPDASQTVPREDMLHILDLCNHLFLFGALNVDFEWKTLESSREGSIWLGDYSSSDRTIMMNPTQVRFSSEKRESRMGTLLHEAIHAFFHRYVCPSCPTYGENVANVGSHGRAFMRVATTFGKATERLFDHRMTLIWLNSWYGNWRAVRYLPSAHDLQQWGWDVDVEEGRVYKPEELCKLMARDLGLRIRDCNIYNKNGGYVQFVHA